MTQYQKLSTESTSSKKKTSRGKKQISNLQGEQAQRYFKNKSHFLKVVICISLIIVTIAVYWQVGSHDFLNYDDIMYITKNHHIQAGLTGEGVVWAFTTGYFSYWHPLTWLSHMLDYEIYELDPRGHHITSLLLHTTNTVLLFLALSWMTGAFWRPAAVAALFALHPVHIESVAWVAERKDVLSTFFWMLTILAYVRYVNKPGIKIYLLVVLTFALGLMAKPMLVTLPFVLLLLDYWPLRRFTNNVSGANDNLRRYYALFREKLPLLVLSTGASIVTFLVQRNNLAMRSLEHYPVQIRIENAIVSYIKYIAKMIWPGNLAVFYPHPMDSLPVWQIAGATLLLVSITFLVFREARRYPYFIVGWLWFLVTLLPVIGIVQVGIQAMADRYSYVSLTGLFIAVIWGLSSVVTRWPKLKAVVSVTLGVVISGLIISTWFQLNYWRNSITLFEHTLKVTSNNPVAHNNLGDAYDSQGLIEKAVEQYQIAISLNPDYLDARINLGYDYQSQGLLEKAVEQYQIVISLNPDILEAHNNLCVAYARQGLINRAIEYCRNALRIDPNYAEAHNNLGIMLEIQGKTDQAAEHYMTALKLKPDYPQASNNLARVLESR